MSIAACNKGDDNKGTSTSGLGTNTFTIGATTYSATTIVGYNGKVIATTANGSSPSGSLDFTFNNNTFPSVAGLYKVVGGNAPGAGEMSVTAQRPGYIYISSSSNNVYALVTVASGKVTIDMPAVWAFSVASITDSVQLAANVTQQ